MTARHYDVVVLGRSLGALLAAALLSRRELRVLVLGQGELAPTYRISHYHLVRRNFTLLCGTAPIFRRILTELAQSQRFRRKTSPLDPMFAVLGENFRFEVPPEVEFFAREVEREFPQVQQSIAELYARISDVNARIDAAFEQDAIWPPGTFWERLETGRLAAGLPLTGERDELPLLHGFTDDHPFNQVVRLPALFASHLGVEETSILDLALARLHGSWARGVHHLPGGEQELADFLVERIESFGGVCRLGGRATRVRVKRGRIIGIEEDGDERMTGADAVVTSMTGEALADLAGGEGITRKARDSWPQVTRVGGRFVVNLVLPTSSLPAPLPAEAFLLGQGNECPTLHLQRRRLPAAALEEGEAPGPELDLLSAECLLPTTGGPHLLGARAAVIATLERYLPFLDENVLLIDSPHDGLPAISYERSPDGKRRRRELDRIHLTGASPYAEPMPARLEVTPMSYLGLAGEPIRGPIQGSFLVGPSVLPALGQEGEAKAAWGAAQILTRKDRVRQKLRRQLWTKIETA